MNYWRHCFFYLCHWAKVGTLAPVLLGAAVGCNQHPAIPPGPSPDPSFDLLIPNNIPQGDYWAVSGLRRDRNITQVGTTNLITLSGAFYAQFSGSSIPGKILLNSVPLLRLRTTDTLRLDVSTSSMVGLHTWGIVDTLTGDTLFLPPIYIDQIDSIGPLTYDDFVRSDTSLQLQWNRSNPKTPSDGMLITWLAPNSTYQVSVPDVGQYVVPDFEMKHLVGRGTVILTRYRNDLHYWNGQTIVVTRLSEIRYLADVHQ